MNITQENIIIVGAGLTGLLLAQKLRSKGQRCLILEKSKGVGGRLSTRRIDDKGLDHGAPYLTSVLPYLKREKMICDKGVFFKNGMNLLPKELANDLNIIKDEKVQWITKIDGQWNIETEKGSHFRCQKIILTAPVPQALELLAANSLASHDQSILDIKYSKAIVLMAIMTDVPTHFTSQDLEGHRLLMMRERNLHPKGLVVQMSPPSSEEHFESSDAVVFQEFMKIIKRSSLSDAQIEKFELKRWRYSQPLSTFARPYLEIQPCLYLTGDGFASFLKNADSLVNTL